MDYHCSKIDYFPKDEYSPDPNDSTMAIPCKLVLFRTEFPRFQFPLDVRTKNNLSRPAVDVLCDYNCPPATNFIIVKSLNNLVFVLLFDNN